MKLIVIAPDVNIGKQLLEGIWELSHCYLAVGDASMSGKCSLVFPKAMFRDMRGGCRWLKDMMSLGRP